MAENQRRETRRWCVVRDGGKGCDIGDARNPRSGQGLRPRVGGREEALAMNAQGGGSVHKNGRRRAGTDGGRRMPKLGAVRRDIVGSVEERLREGRMVLFSELP